MNSRNHVIQSDSGDYSAKYPSQQLGGPHTTTPMWLPDNWDSLLEDRADFPKGQPDSLQL